MSHSRRNPETLLESLADFESLVEVGIGRRSDIAAALVARSANVTATDVHDRSVPDGVGFVRDDIVDPNLPIYEGVEAIYAQNLPPELHRPALDVAREVDAAFLFTTLGGDQPAVPVERVTIDSGTLYVARSSESR
ncbi:hypothetical protein SAMN04487967_1204 [Natronorubrum sediminis]|uniref:UPF0146 protein SAMN04487967_1204 n=1 Tax=Natronorubrum sediminis TaxID=640943 RepID=A0A1H6FQL7_9EURY|nr:UPF0146 family protein [Natronorubrum sediminis]SEH13187.1 hypothetical protein SAMN04487967_1204 [Natronorubrum sediminis]